VYDIAFVRKISNGIVVFFKLRLECQCELRWNIWHESQMTISERNKQVHQVLSSKIRENTSLWERARLQRIWYPRSRLLRTHNNVILSYNFLTKFVIFSEKIL
jgi:hypothetical protein